MLIRGGIPPVDFNDSQSVLILASACLIGFFASFLGFVFQSVGQKYTHASEAAILISTESVFGPIFSIIFLNDPFDWKLVLGMIFVFIGIMMSELDIVQIFRNNKFRKDRSY
jgi:drug/metabolite transporter (DMT)-like permease